MNPPSFEPDRVFAEAYQRFEAGDFATAEQRCRDLLRQQPRHALGLYLLGTLGLQAGRLDDAERLLRESIRIDAQIGATHNNLGLVLDRAGRYGEAIDAFRRAIEREADVAGFHSNLGMALAHFGSLEDAAMAFRSALRLQPGDATAAINLANALAELGNDGAVAAARRALELAPQSAKAMGALGAALMRRGELDEAAAVLDRAVAQNPNLIEARLNRATIPRLQGRLAEAERAIREVLGVREDLVAGHHNLAAILEEAGRLSEAEQEYRRVLELQPDHVDALLNLMLLCQRQGRGEERDHLLDELIRVNPQQPIARARIRHAMMQVVPAWHVPMMNDELRNAAYEQAIRRAVPGRHVLDIETGGGLLALMAARAGATQVTTCEAVRAVAARAAQIVKHNGLDRQVRVIARRSTDLEIGVHMAERADVLVSEILSSDAIAEGALPTIEDAKARLLKPGAVIIPARIAIRAVLVGGGEIEALTHVGTVAGFDMRPFNELGQAVVAGQFHKFSFDELSGRFDVFRFDFMAAERFPHERRHIDLKTTRAGRAVGVLQWLHLDLDGEATLENHPGLNVPAWQQVLHCFAEPVALAAGATIRVYAEHTRTRFLICMVGHG